MMRTKGDIKERKVKQEILINFVPIGKENAMLVSQFEEPLRWYSKTYISGILGELYRDGTILRDLQNLEKGGSAYAYYIPNEEEKQKAKEEHFLMDIPGVTRDYFEALEICKKGEAIQSEIRDINDKLHPAMPQLKEVLISAVRFEVGELVRAKVATKIIHALTKEDKP